MDPREGNDTASGQSVAAARRSLPVLSAGDQVLLRRGTTLSVLGDYDPKAADVAFDAYHHPGDAADADKPVWTLSATANFIVWTGNLDGLVFRNLCFEVPPGQTGKPAFRLTVTVPLARAPVFESCDFIGDDGAFVADISADCEALTFEDCSFACARSESFNYGRSGCVFILATSGRRPFCVSRMRWEGNRITNASGVGMLIRSGSSSDDGVAHCAGRFVNADFRNNRWHGCASAGVLLRCGFHAGLRIEDVVHHGWDGLLFEDNLIDANGGAGASLGPNVRDTARPTTIQRNRVLDNGRLTGTTGGLQLMGLRHALVQDNELRGNWTTDVFDGVNLFMDIFDEATDEMQTTGAMGCVVRRNVCSGARGAGGLSYGEWLTEQRQNPNSSNAPSSGIRLYFARGNWVYANVLVNNGSGVACDKSADNQIFNNTAYACTLGYYDGVGLGTRGNRFFNNVSLLCDWDIYGLGVEGWTPALPTTGVVELSAVDGSAVRFRGEADFSWVRYGVHSRNFFIRERADRDARGGLAVVSMKQQEGELQAHVLRPFSALRFSAGELVVGAMEPYLPIGFASNARHGAKRGSLKEIAPGPGDVLVDPQLDAALAPGPGSPLRGAGSVLPETPFGPPTDHRGQPFAARPTIGAFEVTP